MDKSLNDELTYSGGKTKRNSLTRYKRKYHLMVSDRYDSGEEKDKTHNYNHNYSNINNLNNLNHAYENNYSPMSPMSPAEKKLNIPENQSKYDKLYIYRIVKYC